jgi:hypothetical protein
LTAAVPNIFDRLFAALRGTRLSNRAQQRRTAKAACGAAAK